MSCLRENCLKPRAEQAAGTAAELEVVSAVGEVAGVDLGGADVFDVAEECQFGCDLRRGEEELEGLAGELDASGKGVVGELLEERKCGAGLAVVEDYATACGPLAMKAMVERNASRVR